MARKPARKAHPLALDVGAGVAKEFERARKIAELDAHFFEQSLRVALDGFESFLAYDLGQRNLACDIGDGGGRAMGAGGPARLAAAARLTSSSRCGFGHGFLASALVATDFAPARW